jgi:hypothetical protein
MHPRSPREEDCEEGVELVGPTPSISGGAC